MRYLTGIFNRLNRITGYKALLHPYWMGAGHLSMQIAIQVVITNTARSSGHQLQRITGYKEICSPGEVSGTQGLNRRSTKTNAQFC